jgi:hypothetical protein
MDTPKETLTNPPPTLMDMRTAYATVPGSNEPPGLATQRKVLKDKPNDFLDRMTALEKAWMAQETAAIQPKAEREAREKAVPLEPEELEDEGTENVQVLIARLLEKLEE